MSSSSSLNTLINQFREQRPIRAGSLIITIFGDSRRNFETHNAPKD